MNEVLASSTFETINRVYSWVVFSTLPGSIRNPAHVVKTWVGVFILPYFNSRINMLNPIKNLIARIKTWFEEKNTTRKYVVVEKNALKRLRSRIEDILKLNTIRCYPIVTKQEFRESRNCMRSVTERLESGVYTSEVFKVDWLSGEIIDLLLSAMLEYNRKYPLFNEFYHGAFYPSLRTLYDTNDEVTAKIEYSRKMITFIFKGKVKKLEYHFVLEKTIQQRGL